MEIAFLIIGLIERVVSLAPEIVSLIERWKAGEEITPEEIERTEELVKASVARWKQAGEEPKAGS